MAEIQDLSITDGSNTGRWPENMAFSSVNNAGRADEGILARWYKDTDASLTASGAANAFAVTTNRTIAALFNNMTLTFTANHTISGASTLNVNGLGAKSILRFNGTGLASGDITSGQPVTVIYKSSPDKFYMMTAAAALVSSTTLIEFTETTMSTPAANVAGLAAIDDGSGSTVLTWIDSASSFHYLRNASQAEMEAGTYLTRLVPVGRQHYHPGHPKGWGISSSSALIADYGVSSLTDAGTGNFGFNWDTVFSGTYAVLGTMSEHAVTGSSTVEIGSILVGSAQFLTHWATSGGGRVDPAFFSGSAFGDLA
jgi:hypothetical protein